MKAIAIAISTITLTTILLTPSTTLENGYCITYYTPTTYFKERKLFEQLKRQTTLNMKKKLQLQIALKKQSKTKKRQKLTLLAKDN
jgi:hypothetical protein